MMNKKIEPLNYSNKFLITWKDGGGITTVDICIKMFQWLKSNVVDEDWIDENDSLGFYTILSFKNDNEAILFKLVFGKHCKQISLNEVKEL